MCVVLPFSHRMREYMLRTLTPSCFLVKNFRPEAIAAAVGSVGVPRRRGTGVLDLDMAERGRGVRGKDEVCEWKAYVMKSDSDRMTSWLKLDATRTSKAPIK
jgi:hypothetical protein